MLMSLNNCTSLPATDACNSFEYITISKDDTLTPLTQRLILNNDLVLQDVCKKPLPKTPPDDLHPSLAVGRRLS